MIYNNSYNVVLQSRDSGYDAGDDILWEKEEDFCKDMELSATAV